MPKVHAMSTSPFPLMFQDVSAVETFHPPISQHVSMPIQTEALDADFETLLQLMQQPKDVFLKTMLLVPPLPTPHCVDGGDVSCYWYIQCKYVSCLMKQEGKQDR
jgi:hypothetical protein